VENRLWTMSTTPEWTTTAKVCLKVESLPRAAENTAKDKPEIRSAAKISPSS